MSNGTSAGLLDNLFAASILFMYALDIIPFRWALLLVLVIIALRRY